MESIKIEAVEWWKNLDQDKKDELIIKYFPDKDPEINILSSNTIEIIYLKENQNRKL